LTVLARLPRKKAQDSLIMRARGAPFGTQGKAVLRPYADIQSR
jgi:hypothetical protein